MASPQPSTGARPLPSSGPVPTDFKIYRPPNITNADPLPALSDDYFNPTTADLRAAQATLTARTNALVNAPLQLKAKREAAEKSKRDRWPETRIRVKFPDQTQLEKSFPSTDKIRSVYAFVRGCLRDDVKPIKFILYQTPPIRDLKVSDPTVRDLSLVELQLAPSSILLLRFEDESLNHDQAPAPLLPSILEQAIDLPVPAPPPESQPTPQAGSSRQTLSTSTIQTNSEKKIPKWLKLGKK
ncbi:hypothetical protein H1R20_g7732, partial [Candolleomyces eurysporus]